MSSKTAYEKLMFERSEISMNAKERFDKAMTGNGIATTAMDGGIWVVRQAGVSFADLFGYEDKGASLMIKAAEDWGSDLVWSTFGGFGPITQGAGCEMRFDKVGEPGEITKPLIADIDDAGTLKKTDEQIRADLLADQGIQDLVEQTKRIKEGIKGEKYVTSSDTGPFTLAAQMLGVEDFLVAVFDEDNEENVRTLLDYALRVSKIYGDIILDAGAEVMMLADPVSSPDMISPEIYESFSLPYQRELVAHLKKRAKYVIIHMCGNTTTRLEPLQTVPLDGFSFDRIEIPYALEKARGHYAMLGNLHTVDVMVNGDQALIEKEIDAIADALQDEDGFVIAPGCDLAPITPVENMKYMSDKAKARAKDRA